MSDSIIPLSALPLGKKAKVKVLTSNGAARRRMQDLGLTLDTEIEALHKSPSGDPVAYQIRGAVIALRLDDTARILVEAL